jgi:predicted Zn-dependent peptidase
MARYELSGPGAEWVARYPEFVSRVTARDVRTAAQKLFKTDAVTWVVLGPEEGRPPKD